MPKRATPSPLRQNRQPHSHLGQRRWILRGSPIPLAQLVVRGMRLASTLVQVQQVRSVPVVPPKPQLAKMPRQCVARSTHQQTHAQNLAGSDGDSPGAPRASRSSWRNGVVFPLMLLWPWPGTARGLKLRQARRTQTCTGAGDHSLIPKTSP